MTNTEIQMEKTVIYRVEAGADELTRLCDRMKAEGYEFLTFNSTDNAGEYALHFMKRDEGD